MPWETIAMAREDIATFDRMFRREAKFYAEDSIEQVVIDILRDLGFKVISSREAGLSGHDDADHLAYASRENRILLTKDKDFLNDRKHSPFESPGMIVLNIDPLNRESLEDVLYVLKFVIKPYREIWHKSKVLISKDRQITVWQREHKTSRWQSTRYRLSRSGQAQEWVE